MCEVKAKEKQSPRVLRRGYIPAVTVYYRLEEDGRWFFDADSDGVLVASGRLSKEVVTLLDLERRSHLV